MRSNARCSLGLFTTMAALAAAVFSLAAEPASSRFALGVMRRDGRLVPFASYDGGKWRNRWPTIFRAGQDIPLTVKDLPKGYWPWDEPLLTWKVWPLEGEPRTVTVNAPVLFDSACSRILGLTTTYQPFPTLLPRYTDPYPKDGLATAGDVTIEPIETLAADSPDWKLVTAAIRTEVNESEETTVREMSGGGFRHPTGVFERANTPLQLEVLVKGRTSKAGEYVYYFEGIKSYKPPVYSNLPPGCNILTFFTGWLDVTWPKKGTVVATTDMVNCSREGLAYTVPFGRISVDGHMYWVLQLSGRGYEHYEVVEPGEGKVTRAIATIGGTCK